MNEKSKYNNNSNFGNLITVKKCWFGTGHSCYGTMLGVQYLASICNN